MDTGSGKTHVYVGIWLKLQYYENDQPLYRATLRIMTELQRCSEEKVRNPSDVWSCVSFYYYKQIVWFLAPTVALASQQKEAIESHIPPVSIRLLIGEDGVNRWSEQHIWDAALRDMRVVVSTHAVLADALTHGFVKILERRGNYVILVVVPIYWSMFHAMLKASQIDWGRETHVRIRNWQHLNLGQAHESS